MKVKDKGEKLLQLLENKLLFLYLNVTSEMWPLSTEFSCHVVQVSITLPWTETIKILQSSIPCNV